MDITYLGHSSFKIKGKTASLVTDPFLHKCEIDGSPFVIDGPGEYEVKGISIIGVASGPNTIYVIEMDGLRLCHLGDLGHKLTDSQLEELGSIDIAFLPVGGEYTMEVVKQVDPWIVIPMHYQQPELDAFLKEMGKEAVAIPKLVISHDKLPEETQVVVLERK